MSDLPPRPAFWPYLPGYALLLLSVLLCASGSYRFVTPMALADGVDLVYLSQGLALLPLGTGLVGLLAAFLLHVRGRWLGALLALLPAALICAWNLYNYAAHGDEALSPSFAQYTQALLGLLLLGGVLSLVDLLHGRPSTLLRKGLLGLGWLALVAWLGLLFYLQRLYGLTFELVVGFQRAQRIDIGGAGIQEMAVARVWAISASLAPAFSAASVCTPMQPSQRVVMATAMEISSRVLASRAPSALASSSAP